LDAPFKNHNKIFLFLFVNKYSVQMYKISGAQYTVGNRAALVNKLSTPFVFTIYIFMVMAAFFCVFRYGRNIPIAEDWLLVAPITGNEPDIFSWLWAQNNEHRIPLPKLVMLGLLKISGGNFKVGMYGNVFLLSTMALAVILFLRKMRGGRTKYVDAFFPVLLLHIGNWENMVWSWQLSFVLPTILTLCFFLILFKNPLLNKPVDAAINGFILLMLPLCGGSGLLYVPFLAVWLLYCAVFHWRHRQEGSKRKLLIGILTISSFLSVMLCGLYFIGYQQPTWNPPSPGIVESLKTTGKFVVLSVGPAVKYSWKIAAIAVVLTCGLIAFSIYLIVKSSYKTIEVTQKHRALSLLLFMGILIVFALVIGWGRAGLVPQFGMPDMYVLFASPILIICFFAGEFFERSGYITAVLLLMMLLLLPSNTRAGFKWREWYQFGIMALEGDLAQGISGRELAKRNKTFLIHWWDDKKLSDHIEMFQELKNNPFNHTKASAE
jgi:hypothetical protein